MADFVDASLIMLKEKAKVGMPIYKVWPGKNRFYCGGRCIAGPWSDVSAQCCVFICTAAAVGVYFGIFAYKLATQVSVWLPITFAMTVMTLIAFYILTHCTDPGFIPRRYFMMLKLVNRSPEQIEELAGEKLNILSRDASKEKEASAQCSTCRVHRPPRSSHCSDCGNCLEVSDHHCPFVGTCVGRRNYRYFCMFLLMVVISMIYLIVQIIIFYTIKSDDSTDSPSTTVIVIICVVGIPIGILLLTLIGFCTFHLWLTCRGKTTREFIKKRIRPTDSDQGDIQENEWFTVSRPYINYSYKLTEEDLERIRQL